MLREREQVLLCSHFASELLRDERQRGDEKTEHPLPQNQISALYRSPETASVPSHTNPQSVK